MTTTPATCFIFMRPVAALTMRGLQRGIAQWNHGTSSDRTLQSGFLILVLVTALAALLNEARERRRRNAISLNSAPLLGHELCGAARIGFLDRLLLRRVAGGAGISVALMLVSEKHFAAAVDHWAAKSRAVGPRRRMAKRLRELGDRLFVRPTATGH